jgi:hypothetical protein
MRQLSSIARPYELKYNLISSQPCLVANHRKCFEKDDDSQESATDTQPGRAHVFSANFLGLVANHRKCFEKDDDSQESATDT